MHADNSLLLNAYRANIWKCHAFKFFSMFHFFGGILVPFFTDWGGISFFQITILQSIFTFTIFVMEVPTGAIADKFGRKISLILGAASIGLACLVYSAAPHFLIFVFAEIIWGAGASFLSGANEALLYDSLKELGQERDSKKHIGRWQSLGMIALMIAAPIGSLMAEEFGLRETMFFTALSGVITTGIAFSFTEPQIGRTARSKKYGETILKGFSYLRNHRTLKILAFDTITLGILAYGIIWIYQVALKDIGIPIYWFGFVCSLFTLVQVLILTNFSRLEAWVGGRRRYLFTSALLVGIGFLLVSWRPNAPLLVLGIILVSGFGLTRRTLLNNYMNKFIESDQRATVLSVVSMFNSLSLAILSLIWGYFLEAHLTLVLALFGGTSIFFALVSRVEEEHLLD